MSHRMLCSLACVLLGACIPPVTDRSALVPVAMPVMWNGQPFQSGSQIELSAGGNLGEPGGRRDDEQQLILPGLMLDGTFRLGARDFNVFAGLRDGEVVGEHAAGDPEAPPLDAQRVVGAGGGMAGSFALGPPGLRLALSGELILWSIPQQEFCSPDVDPCGEGSAERRVTERHALGVPGLVLGAIASYRSERMTGFAGVTARNQPTLGPGHGDVVLPGSLVYIVHAGADYEIGSGLRLGAIVFQTVSRDPIDYAPGLAVFVSLPIDWPKSRPRRP
jgi:hypothetical protein